MKNQPNKIRTTKYTLTTFLPLNLYHQFTKLNNVFFLTTLVMLCIPSVSPFTPYTYLIAFSGILLVSMVKDAVEDYKRSQVDKSVNERECIRISGNYFNQYIDEFRRDDAKLEKLKSAHGEILNIVHSKFAENKNQIDTRDLKRKKRFGGENDCENPNSCANFEQSQTPNENKSIVDGKSAGYVNPEQKNRNKELSVENNRCKSASRVYSDTEKSSKPIAARRRHLSYPEPIISDASNQKGSSEFIKNISFFPNKSNHNNSYAKVSTYLNNSTNLQIPQKSNENFNSYSKPFFNSEERIESREATLNSNKNTTIKQTQNYQEPGYGVFSSSSDFPLEMSDSEKKILNENIKVLEQIQRIYENNDVIIFPTEVSTLRKADFVLIRENDEVPADLFLIYSLPNNCKLKDHCFVETSGLDGETNLKRKTHPNFYQSTFSCENIKENAKLVPDKIHGKENSLEDKFYVAETTNDPSRILENKLEHMLFEAITNKRYSNHRFLLSEIILKYCFYRSLCKLDGFEVHTSGQELNDINIKIETEQKTSLYSHQQILLKGSIVKQSAVLGMVISVGNETKQSKNQRIKELSNSNFEKKINANLKLCFVFYFVILSLTGLLGSLFLTKDLPYLYLSENRGATALGLISTNYILFSFLVPISLFVTIEVSRVFMGMFINKDKNFCILANDSPPNQSTSKREQINTPIIFNGQDVRKDGFSEISKDTGKKDVKTGQSYANSNFVNIKHATPDNHISNKEEDKSNPKDKTACLNNPRDEDQRKANNIDTCVPNQGLGGGFTHENIRKFSEGNLIEKNIAFNFSDINIKPQKEFLVLNDEENAGTGSVRLKRHIQIPAENFSVLNQDELTKKYEPVLVNGEFKGINPRSSVEKRVSHEDINVNNDLRRNSHLSIFSMNKTNAQAEVSARDSRRSANSDKENLTHDVNLTIKESAYSLGGKNEINNIKQQANYVPSTHANRKKESINGSFSLKSPSGSWLSMQSSQFNEIENIHCICRNTNIVEDLGNVKYVLTDKTGTLTCNDMSLVYIGTYHRTYDVKSFTSIVSGFRYNNYFQTSRDPQHGSYFSRLRSFINLDSNYSVLNREETFLMICLGLMVCNSVEIFNNNYEGQSQDEVCILNGLKNVIQIENRTEKIINIDFLGSKLSVEILMTLDFSSSRRRMSIVVKIDERIFLFSKGSDSTIQTHLHKNFRAPRINEKYSAYRSLMISFRELKNTKEESHKNHASTANKTENYGFKNSSEAHSSHLNEIKDRKNILYSEKTHGNAKNNTGTNSKYHKQPSDSIKEPNDSKNIADGPQLCRSSNDIHTNNSILITNRGNYLKHEDVNRKEISCDQNGSSRSSKIAHSVTGGFHEVSQISSAYDSEYLLAQKTKDIHQILREYNSLGLEDHDIETEKLFDTIEKNMLYLGSTFVEDRIQKGVKRCIKDLLTAGINVWMVTGDKEESAKSCGMQCGLQLSEDYLRKSGNTNISYKDATRKPHSKIENELRCGGRSTTNNASKIYVGSQCTDNRKNLRNRTLPVQNASRYRNPRDPGSSYAEIITAQNKNSPEDLSNEFLRISRDENKDDPAKFSHKHDFNVVQNRCFTISADKAIEKLKRKEVLPQTAIIFRASPEQKAEIAKLLDHVVAIGDGNNDIMMIQESDVGIGIRGKEGTQASLSADISAPCFLALRRLILVHGHYNYARVSKVALNSLYKNLLLIFVQFYYNFFNGYSGRPVFNFFFLNYFNVLFTSFIPLYIIIFDKDKEDTDLLENPKNYSSSKKYFNKSLILMNVFLAITKASILFWLTYFMFKTTDFTDRNGLIGGYGAMNNWFSLIVFLTVFFRQIRMINFFNMFSIVVIFLSMSLYFFSVFVIQEFSIETRNSAFHIYSMPIFYVGLLVVFGLIFFLDFIYDVIHSAIIHRKCQDVE